MTEAVRRKPYSVVLFDEIEKAHPDVFNTLLQILDEGRLTDGKGRTVDFKNTVIIMTSNMGSQWIQDPNLSKEEIRERVMAELRAGFRPEFLNRIDEIIIFNRLTMDEIKQIVDLQLDQVRERLRERRMDLILTDSAREELAKLGYDPVYGARPLRRVIQKQVLDPLAVHMLEGKFKDGDTIEVDFVGNEFVFNLIRREEAE